MAHVPTHQLRPDQVESTGLVNYPYIWADGYRSGSYTYYMEGQARDAARDNAPADALRWSLDRRRWITAREYMDNPTARITIDSVIRVGIERKLLRLKDLKPIKL